MREGAIRNYISDPDSRDAANSRCSAADVVFRLSHDRAKSAVLEPLPRVPLSAMVTKSDRTGSIE